MVYTLWDNEVKKAWNLSKKKKEWHLTSNFRSAVYGRMVGGQGDLGPSCQGY